MRALDVAEKWYFDLLAPALEAEFGEVSARIAAGVAGRGSQCFGYDDEVSRDHDYGIGLSLWLTDEDDLKYAIPIHRTFQKLHRELPEIFTASRRSAHGYCEEGVTTISAFYRRHTGSPGVPETFEQWLATPAYAFAEAVNGKVFSDIHGEFSRIRHEIKFNMPENVRLKKLSFHTIMAAQSGQYNFPRSLKHGETGAAMLALTDFVRHASEMVFLLNHTFAPYYKWIFRAMSELPHLGEVSGILQELLTAPTPLEQKNAAVEAIAAIFAGELQNQQLCADNGTFLEPYAFELQNRITDRRLRECHIMQEY
ncbi:MAG: DUF4037 domain-containing protein [Lentisphaerae bacterium]|nr:DUF4037 domain-containing protein [Lentisphaerota bacterium]